MLLPKCDTSSNRGPSNSSLVQEPAQIDNRIVLNLVQIISLG